MTATEELKAQAEDDEDREAVSIYSGASLAKLRQQDVMVGELRDKYLHLKISGFNDKAGFEVVHKARMHVKKFRLGIADIHKELKEQALKHCQAVDGEKRRLNLLIEPIESHLQAEEDAFEAEKDRLKRAEEDARREALQKRLDSLAELGIVANPRIVEGLTIEQFGEEVRRAREQFDERKAAQEKADAVRKAEELANAAERQRLAEDTAKLRAERERINAEHEREQAELKAAREAIEADRRRIEAEKESQRRAVELEKAKAEAAEKARIETENRLAFAAARDKADAETRALQEAARAERQQLAAEKAERERPQRERIMGVAEAVAKIPVPAGPGHAAVIRILGIASQKITEIANGKLE